MTDSAPDDPVTADRIPDLIQIGAIPSEFGQSLSTDIIDATTITQTKARFTLQRVAGFLHSNSKVTLAVTPKTNTRGYYPLNVGISNLVKTATLSIGNQVVCSVDDYSVFHSYASLFITNEDNKEREQYLSQRGINHAPRYEARSVADITDIPPNSAPKVSLDLGRNPVVNKTTGAGATELLPFQENDGTSAQTISEAPVYSVYLSDLFPFMKYNQLPTFMIDQEIHIDITFQDKVSSISGNSRALRMLCHSGGDQAVEYDIDTQECKLIYDSISYDGEVMQQYAEQNKTLTFSYVDYRLAKRTGDETAFSNLTFPIGGNGRLVSKVMFALQPHASAQARSLVGQNSATAPLPDSELSMNLRYNDRFEFSIDRSNKALLFHTTQQAEGMVPMVTKDEYSKCGTDATPRNILTTDTFEGHAQSSQTAGLYGNFSWVAVKPNRNERINNQGIDLIYKNSGLAGGNYTLRTYLELLKVATIKDGQFNCYFA